VSVRQASAFPVALLQAASLVVVVVNVTAVVALQSLRLSRQPLALREVRTDQRARRLLPVRLGSGHLADGAHVVLPDPGRR
jgi:hypothetical protein